MSKKVSLLFFALIFFIYPSLIYAENFKKSLMKNSSLSRTGDDNNNSAYKTIQQWQYFAGGVLGTFLGVGIGHAIQERWTKTGWMHTALQLSLYGVGGYAWIAQRPFEEFGIGMAGILVSVLGAKSEDIKKMQEEWRSPPLSEERKRTLNILFYSCIIAFLGARVWEIVDVWVLPSSVKTSVSQKKLQLAPSFFSYKNNTFSGLEFKYSF